MKIKQRCCWLHPCLGLSYRCHSTSNNTQQKHQHPLGVEQHTRAAAGLPHKARKLKSCHAAASNSAEGGVCNGLLLLLWMGTSRAVVGCGCTEGYVPCMTEHAGKPRCQPSPVPAAQESPRCCMAALKSLPIRWNESSSQCGSVTNLRSQTPIDSDDHEHAVLRLCRCSKTYD